MGLIFSCACLVACATTSDGPQVQGDFAARARNFIAVTEPGFRPAARAACALTISLAVDPQDQAKVKQAVHDVSSIVAAWNGQSPDDLEKSLEAVLPKEDEYRGLAQSVSALCAIASPFIRGDPQLLLKVTSDVAAGCADATRLSAVQLKAAVRRQ